MNGARYFDGVQSPGRRLPYEGWIAAEPFRGDVGVIITGPHRFARRAAFALDEDPAEVTRRVRETIDDEF
jgi:hypothetical protein